MIAERDLLIKMGMPESVAVRKEMFSPTSVGVIVHTGNFNFEESRQWRSGEPEVLLVRQADQLVDNFHPWGIPAGRAKWGEGIIQVAAREVAEETGISVDVSRLRWFCPVGNRRAVLSYRIVDMEIPHYLEYQEYELGIKVFSLNYQAEIKEIDRLALVPVEVFADHMLVGSKCHYRRKDLLPNYIYYPKSEEADENIDFVPTIYKPEIWQAIRHQMFARGIIPPYLG